MEPETIDLRTDWMVQQAMHMDRPVVALAYDYPAGDRVPLHDHPKAQLIYAIEGTMVVSTREGRWILLPTRAAWVPAHTRHTVRMRDRVKMRTVFFDHTIAPPSATCAVLHVSPLLRELIVSMLHEEQAYLPESRGAHIAALIVGELRLSPTLPLHLPWPNEPRLRRICNALQKHPSLSGDMNFWAAKAEVSARTLARLFRADLGMSFHEWRSQLLLLEAQIRLAQGQSSTRVAQSLGYASPAAFSAMFRKSAGLPPTRQRRLLQTIPE